MDYSTNALGVSASEYHAMRTKHYGWGYRKERRASQVVEAIQRCRSDQSFDSILDVGVADGLTLQKIVDRLNVKHCFGVDMSLELMGFGSNNNGLSFVQSDAVVLPFKSSKFDLVTATAIIEHVSSISLFLTEIYRVLKSGGMVVITTPDPFWDRLAGRILPIFKEVHIETLTLANLKEYLQDTRFEFVYGEKFMLSPIGFPFEQKVERILRTVRLTFSMLNQVAVGVKHN